MGSKRKAVTVVAVLVAALAFGEEVPLTAAEISRKSRERGALNLMDLQAELRLTTTTKSGQVKEQQLLSAAKKVGGRDCSLARFSLPVSVQGVAVLTVSGEAGGADDISLYLPKLKRVRKVAKSDRGKAFMDTDFSYADLGRSGSGDDEAKRQPDAQVDGRDVYVLKGKGEAESPYGEVTLSVDKQTFVPLKAEYTDKEGRPLKLYRALKLKKFKERVLAAESSMENLQTGSKTVISVLKLEDAPLPDEAFTERGLERQ